MPNYGVAQAGGVLTCVETGDNYTLFNAETLTAPQASVAFCPAFPADGGQRPSIMFTIHFASAPTSRVAIQGSNVDVDAQYVDLVLSDNLQDDFYGDFGSFRFYRARLVTQSAGGALTVIAQR